LASFYDDAGVASDACLPWRTGFDTCAPHGARSTGPHTMTQNKTLKRAGIAIAALAVLAACEKHDATAGQAVGALNNLASQASQKMDQASNYVGQHVDAVKDAAQQNLDSATTVPSISASGVADTARANLEGAASATNAAIANAASNTGAGLQTAGRKLQQWAASDGTAGSSTSATPDAGDSRASRTDMDK
jgi:hypothetical protein